MTEHANQGSAGQSETGRTTEVMMTDAMKVAVERIFEDARTCLSDGEPLNPFSIICTSDGFEVSDHAGETEHDIRDSVRALLASEMPEAYAFAYDGFIDTDTGRRDAVLCELARRGDAAAAMLALPYGVREGGVDFAESYAYVGNAVPMYPRGTRPIVSGLVALEEQRARAAQWKTEHEGA